MGLALASRALLLSAGLLPAGLESARAGEPDPLEAIRRGDAWPRTLFAAEEAGSIALVRAAGRDLAPVAADGSYRLEGLPLGRHFRLEVLGWADPAGLAYTDPILIPEPGPGPGAAHPLDLASPFGVYSQEPLRRGIDLLGSSGARSITFGAPGARALLAATALTAALNATVPNDAPHAAPIDLSAAGVEIRSTHPQVVLIEGRAPENAPDRVRIKAVGRGRAWAVLAVDGEEAAVAVRLDPALDSDQDGLPDSYEIAHGLNPVDPLDASLDADLDGLTNLEELKALTDPRVSDTDGDGLLDGIELTRELGDPLRPGRCRGGAGPPTL